MVCPRYLDGSGGVGRKDERICKTWIAYVALGRSLAPKLKPTTTLIGFLCGCMRPCVCQCWYIRVHVFTSHTHTHAKMSLWRAAKLRATYAVVVCVCTRKPKSTYLHISRSLVPLAVAGAAGAAGAGACAYVSDPTSCSSHFGVRVRRGPRPAGEVAAWRRYEAYYTVRVWRCNVV